MSDPHRRKLTPAQERAIYEAGMAARHDRKGIGSCPYGASEFQRRSWFLAGWHDADIALAAEKLAIQTESPAP